MYPPCRKKLSISPHADLHPLLQETRADPKPHGCKRCHYDYHQKQRFSWLDSLQMLAAALWHYMGPWVADYENWVESVTCNMLMDPAYHV